MQYYHSNWQSRSPSPRRNPSRRGRGRSFWKEFWQLGKAAFLWLFKMIWAILRWIFTRKGIVKKLIALGFAVALILFIFIGSLFVFYSFRVPDPNQLVERVIPESTKIFDRNGELLYEVFGDAKRTLVNINDIPEDVKNATIAIEDQNFYNHRGISIRGILRAAVTNLRTGSQQGGSTITQQFVKNAVLTNEKTFARKLKEAVLSLQLERNLTKDEILQLYLNEIPYGSNSFGIEAASQTFFGKDVKNLSIAEAAYLAALPKAPTFFSPYGPNREELDARADTVIQLMYEQGYITEDERNQAQNEQVEFKTANIGITAPHFSLWIQDLLAQEFGELALREDGLKVTTSLDLSLQKIAEEVIAEQTPINEQNYGATNASLVALDPNTGEVLAMVGSRDFFSEDIDGQVNVALRPRQPGSSFKPYIYATAFKEGYSPATMLMDVETNFGEFGAGEGAYIPQNFDGSQHGPVSIRTALQGSLNIPAVKTTILVGIDDAIDTAESMGITTLKDRSRFGPSIVLGGGEVKLLDHASAYGTFATGGIHHAVQPILKIEDKHGNILKEFEQGRGQEVLDPQIAYQINNVLSDNNARAFVFGTNNRLTLPGRPVAAKTGTTQEARDAWTVGYTPSLVTGVWAGNNDNTPMLAGGSTVAGPIWQTFMIKALEDKPVEEFVRPEGIEDIVVDELSGKLPTAFTPSTKVEIFAQVNKPSEFDDLHVPDGNGGVKTILRSEMPNDPNWEEPVQAWARANGYGIPDPIDRPVDEDILISINTENTVNALPWELGINVQTNNDISRVSVFLDNNPLVTSDQKAFGFSSGTPFVDGAHTLRVEALTTAGSINQTTQTVNFNLNQDVTLLPITNSQNLSFPVSLTLQSNRDADPEEVSFILRSGSDSLIAGNVTKERVGEIINYRLIWTEEEKPPAGNYEIIGRINNTLSNKVGVTVP